jgi:hypothetical protein
MAYTETSHYDSIIRRQCFSALWSAMTRHRFLPRRLVAGVRWRIEGFFIRIDTALPPGDKSPHSKATPSFSWSVRQTNAVSRPGVP